MPRGKSKGPLWPLPPVRPAPPRVAFTATRLQSPEAGLPGALLALAIAGSVEGSATLVGPGLALCANHVLRAASPHEIAVQGTTEAGTLAWTVKHVLHVPDSDLAMLSMTLAAPLPANRALAVAHMTTRMPVEGEPVTLLGFPPGTGASQATRGTVSEVFLGGRERVTGPSVAVSCAAFPGLAGAVVFDARGYLVGAVSSTSAAATYVSHVVPALMCPVTPEWPEHDRAPAASLLHLGVRHGVHLERPDAFQVGAKAGKVVVRYVPWS
jgi:hypothetical protein